MKKLICAILLVPMLVLATITPEQEFALNRMNSVAQKHQLGSLLHKNTNTVVGKYSYAVQGGAVGDISLLSDLNDTASTITIPDNAIVKQVFVDVLTQPTGTACVGSCASGTSVGVKLVNSGDLVANTGIASFTGRLAGVPVDTAATMIKLSADKVLKATISNSVATAGVFNVYIEYVLGD